VLAGHNKHVAVRGTAVREGDRVLDLDPDAVGRD
jgi:hypothetical protein